MTIQIAVLGAESTGKSILIAELLAPLAALQPRPIWAVPEVLRQFCVEHNRAPFAKEQSGILDRQIAVERAAIAESQNTTAILLSDCAPITTAIYSVMYFSDASLMAMATQHHQRYQLSLVLSPDIGWHADPLPFMRDGPSAQLQFHQQLLDWLNVSRMPYQLIAGQGTIRTQRALDAIIKSIR